MQWEDSVEHAIHTLSDGRASNEPAVWVFISSLERAAVDRLPIRIRYCSLAHEEFMTELELRVDRGRGEARIRVAGSLLKANLPDSSRPQAR